jgi:NAD(P)H-hydrate repair Nnr-like enzyme with NAD(P)H-hydrate dehydratase domain
MLAGLAALRAGAGRLQVLTVDTTSVAVAVALPEAMVLGLPADAGGSLSPDAAEQMTDAVDGAGTVVLGPGLVDRDGARQLLERLLPRLEDDTAVVLDAVALTALAGAPELVAPVAGRLVLTPNAGELAALLDGAGPPTSARPRPPWPSASAPSSRPADGS